jgi:hypothetical protein
MAARTPRRHFATPFVVTLAAAPACYVQSSPSSPQPPPPVAQPAPGQPASTQAPPVVVNPPPPGAASQPGPTTAPPPATTAQPAGGAPAPVRERRWTVFRNDRGCSAMVEVKCPPGAMCNPPPPVKYACPDSMAVNDRITIVSYDGTTCQIEPEMPKCPPNTRCNPPPPRQVACPTR